MNFPYSKIAVEMQPTNPPKPTGFGVISGDKVVAFLEYQEVQQALEKYEQMMRVWQKR